MPVKVAASDWKEDGGSCCGENLERPMSSRQLRKSADSVILRPPGVSVQQTEHYRVGTSHGRLAADIHPRTER